MHKIKKLQWISESKNTGTYQNCNLHMAMTVVIDGDAAKIYIMRGNEQQCKKF